MTTPPEGLEELRARWEQACADYSASTHPAWGPSNALSFAASALIATLTSRLTAAEAERDEARRQSIVRHDCWKSAEAQLARVAELIAETYAEDASSIWPRLNELIEGVTE